MIELYPDIDPSDEVELAGFVEEANLYVSSLFGMACNLLGWYRVYPGWCEAYAAFAHGYPSALRLDVLEGRPGHVTLSA